MAKGTLKVCKNGHRFYKNSDCPTCAKCEEERKPMDGFLSLLSAPARRALENKGVTSLTKVSKYSEEALSKLHGMGPNAIVRLKASLKSAGLSLRK
jgi:hypothetical protein